jgi:hypothetical protein
VSARPLDAARDALTALQGQLIAMLAAQNAALAARVAELEERLARLERAASRNSGNSSLPPSLDDQPGRTPPPGKPQRDKRGKRNPGKQPGAPGSHLAWSENPGQAVPHFPRGACACGADLAAAADLGGPPRIRRSRSRRWSRRSSSMTCMRWPAGAVHHGIRRNLRRNGTQVIKTSVQLPRANSFAGRFETLRRECLDHVLILGVRDLRKILAGYAQHYNDHRPHQACSRNLRCARPATPAISPPRSSADRSRRPDSEYGIAA